ncbi:MAG: hypothetical protein G01um10148_976 [Parcubacteria group bacterium Gr01-1014_8]|nr:MAG: hypothetical protein G01um10148_976 [Parcubacteria group bacterium Gr01-1014_8]
MSGPDDMQGAVTRRNVLKAAAALGAMAAAPLLFATIADARDCEGKRCGNWHMKPSPERRENPEEVKKFKEDMNTVVSEYKNIQELLNDILTHHKLDPKRFTITMSPPGRAIEIAISENGKSVGSFGLSTMQLRSAYGVDSGIPPEQLINKKGFQTLFFKHLQELRLMESK